MGYSEPGDRLLLGIDVEPTGAKAVLFSPYGELFALRERKYGVTCPRPGWAEQNQVRIKTHAEES
jgi:sugar (pentulose or hexulose) kinase